MRKIGKIKWFGGHNNKTGRQNDFGFIACEGKPNDIFVHLRQINCSATALREGTIVTFEVITNFRDGKEEAKNLRLLIDETDTEIIAFCAKNKDPNLWIPVYSKYLANFSIDEAILLIFQKLETLSDGERISFVRTLPNQILFSHKARKIREIFTKDEHLNLCVKMLNERVSLAKDYSFKEEINATIEGASVQVVEKIWESIPSELYVDVPEQRKRFNLKIHARCLVKLIFDAKDDQSKNIFLMELRERLQEANKDESWEIIPDEILMSEQVWPIAPQKHRVRVLVNKLEKNDKENNKEIIGKIAQTIAEASRSEHPTLLSEIPEWLKENEAFFPFKTPLEQVNLVWNSIEDGLWSLAWPRLSKEAKIICVYRVLKDKINTNTFFAELKKLKIEKPENEPLVKYVINILWVRIIQLKKMKRSKGHTNCFKNG
jgi:cold shock CspA family protein